jgi:hypothetical protein
MRLLLVYRLQLGISSRYSLLVLKLDLVRESGLSTTWKFWHHLNLLGVRGIALSIYDLIRELKLTFKLLGHKSRLLQEGLLLCCRMASSTACCCWSSYRIQVLWLPCWRQSLSPSLAHWMLVSWALLSCTLVDYIFINVPEILIRNITIMVVVLVVLLEIRLWSGINRLALESIELLRRQWLRLYWLLVVRCVS